MCGSRSGFGVGHARIATRTRTTCSARLKPGVSLDEARAGPRRRSPGHWRQEFPTTNSGRGIVAVAAGRRRRRCAVRPALMLLSGAVALVLLIACANVANLFLARAVARQREIAVRAAFGAGRWRLARQVLAESAHAHRGGTLLGLLLAGWAVDALVALAPVGIPRAAGDRDRRRRCSIFTMVVSAVVGVAFGVLPALVRRGPGPGRFVPRRGSRGPAAAGAGAGFAPRWSWPRSRSPWSCWWAPPSSS